MKGIDLIAGRNKEIKSVSTGKKDAFLVGLFAILSFAGLQVVEWLVNGGLDLLDGMFHASWWPAVKYILVLGLTMLLKGVDRKKHEDITNSTGLIKL